MTASEFIRQNHIDLAKVHGNVGDYNGNLLIEKQDRTGWTFWRSDGLFEDLLMEQEEAY